MTAQTHAPVNGADVLDLRGGRRRLRPVPELAAEPTADAAVEVGPVRKPSRLASGTRGMWQSLTADLDNWGALAWEPPSLSGWLAARDTERVPDDWRLRAAWHLDHWTVGLFLAAVSVALFCLAATVRWMACHPARRWVFIGVTCTYVAWLTQA